MSTAGMRQAGSRRSLGTSYVGFLRSLVVAVARSVGRRSDLTVTKNPEMFSAGAQAGAPGDVPEHSVGRGRGQCSSRQGRRSLIKILYVHVLRRLYM